MLALIPTNATEIKTENSDTTTSFYAVKDKNGVHYYGPTGNNLTDKEDVVEDVTVIDSLSDYNNIANNDSTVNNKLIRKATKLPKVVDNSQSIYFPEIGDQLDLGSCLFWAQIYYQYTYEMNKSTNTPTTADNVFSPQWSYNVATAGADMQCTTINSLNFMKYQGNVPMSQIPYDLQYKNAYPTEEVWRNAINYRIKDYYFLEDVGTFLTPITSPDDSDLTLIKTALNNGEILTYSTMMYGWTHTELTANADAPENDKYIGQEAVTSMDSQDGGHRMTLVGYNDNIWIDINKNSKVDKGEMGAFKIANSWGTEYGNNGFCWVAYDALNDTSCVDGVEENPERSSIFTEITRIEVLPYGTNTDLYLKFTVNTSNRTQVATSITAEKDATVQTISSLSNMCYGDPLAYDGAQHATDATMIFPIQTTFPDVTLENYADYTWTVNFQDTMSDDYTLIVKDAKIVNEATGECYEVNNAFPFELNGERKSIQLHESDLNHAIVYYRGYYTPSINYKLDKTDSQWKKDIPIEKNFEKYGYTHKFVLDLEDTEGATIYFSDENGNIDDNNGAYFTATKGVNYYITENLAKPLSLKMTNDLDEVADVGRFGLFTTTASGGYEPYLFEYVVTNLTTGETVVEEYENRPEKGHYFNTAGDYMIVVTLKDCTGAKISDINRVTITPIPFEFTTFEATSQNNNIVNLHPITFTAITNFENIGIHYSIYNEYDLTIKRDGITYYNTTIPMKYDLTNAEYMTSTIIASWTPSQAGTYTATISATDCAGEYAEKTITFVVNNCIIGDADGDGEVNIVDATYLQMYLAKKIDRKCLRILTADTDKDGNATINDVTVIQRYIAQFADPSSIGEIIYSAIC